MLTRSAKGRAVLVRCLVFLLAPLVTVPLAPGNGPVSTTIAAMTVAAGLCGYLLHRSRRVRSGTEPSPAGT